MQPLTRSQARQATQAYQLLGRGDALAALSIARQLVRLAPLAPDAHHLLALCLARSGDLAAAEQAFLAALAQAPGQPSILANFATLLRRAGRPLEALERFRAAVEAAPGFATGWIELGLTALELGRHEQADTALQRAIALSPESAAAWHGLGHARQAAGEFESAEAAFRKSTTLAPADGRMWTSLGTALRLLGRTEQAIASFARAEQTGFQAPELRDAWAGALLDQGEVDAALLRTRQLVRDHPEFIPGHRSLAHLLWEHGPALAPDEDPLASLAAAARAQPQNHALQLAFVGLLLSASRASEALDQLQRLRQRGDHPMLQALQAEAFDRLGRPELAAPLFDAAYRVFGGSDPSFLNTYVRHLLANGKWDRAARLAGEALQTDPCNQEALAYLSTAWRLLDDPRELQLCDYDRLIQLVEVDTPDGYRDTAAFLTELVDALDAIHTARREPMHQSLRHGSQTAGRLFGRSSAVIAAAQQVLSQAVERWLVGLPRDARHPFLSRNSGRVRIAGSWSVKLWTSGKHVNHMHSEGWLSSAFYVALPPSVAAANGTDPHAGCIQFGQPPDELGLRLPPRRVIRPQAGRLALFPSYLWHGTVPFHDPVPRVTIAFDMLPK